MEMSGGAYFDPDFDSLLDRIPPPRVCIDNDACEDFTLVKVDSANRHGILLEMVQVLTDLDLVISKSYISSDGGWLMDVFHVTDHLGKKLTDPALIQYIQQCLVGGRKGVEMPQVMTCLGKVVGPLNIASEYTALEVTATNQQGLLSEISAVLANLDCYLLSCYAWTHNHRAAIVAYIVDEGTGKPISDSARLAHIQEEVESVVGAHLGEGELWRVGLSGPTPGRVHAERRLHQLMHEDRDYEAGPLPRPVEGDQFSIQAAVMEARRSGGGPSAVSMETRVSIESWEERGYWVVNVRSRDRPKLLFDTVCTLTDMKYLVFHAAVSSHGPLAIQEYYIRHMEDCAALLHTEKERQRVTRCLVAAVERRVSHGLKMEVRTKNRKGLLSDVSRVIRESGLSLTRTECAAAGETAVGTFYVINASSGGSEVDPEILELLKKELGGEGVKVKVSSSSGSVSSQPGWQLVKKVFSNSGNPHASAQGGSSIITNRRGSGKEQEEQPRASLGSILWSHIERLSSNFGSIRS